MFVETSIFNRKVIGIKRDPGTIQDRKEFDFLIGSVIEELSELTEAHEKGDFIGEIDAIMDAIYFLGGGLVRMGLAPNVCSDIFQAIHECNLQKKLGKKESRDVTHDLDAVKPKDWKGPEEAIMGILDKYYKCGNVNKI